MGALLKGNDRFETYLVGGDVARATEIADSLARQGKWQVIVDGVVEVIVNDHDLYDQLASLPAERQRGIVRAILPYTFRASEQGENAGLTALFAFAIAMNLSDVVSEIATWMAQRNLWGALADGIFLALEDADLMSEDFWNLPAEEGRALWCLLIPYALQAVEHGERKGLECLLRYHNPLRAQSVETWLYLYSPFARSSNARKVFWESVLNPKSEFPRASWQFTPEQYARLVVVHILKGSDFATLNEIVRQASKQRPEILEAIVRLADRFPGELLPLIDGLTSSATSGL